jgi:hypothetical protein
MNAGATWDRSRARLHYLPNSGTRPVFLGNYVEYAVLTHLRKIGHGVEREVRKVAERAAQACRWTPSRGSERQALPVLGRLEQRIEIHSPISPDILRLTPFSRRG